MNINILYLYNDLLNLYGESGNIKAIKNYFNNQDIKVKIINKTLNEEINLDDIDLIYIGSGTENNQNLVINHLKKYNKIIKKYIKSNKYILATGNSIEIFGKYIIKNNKKINTLNIFDYYSKANDSRLICESVMNYQDENKIIGFQNRLCEIYGIENSIQPFEIIKGYGSNKESNKEGIKYKNFFGTYLVGPLLVRNPILLKEICNNIIYSKNKKYKIKEIDFDLENKSLKSNLNRYLSRK